MDVIIMETATRWLDLAKEILYRPTASLVFIIFILLIHTAPLGAMVYMSYRIESAVVRLS
jgi:hypothetical protein